MEQEQQWKLHTIRDDGLNGMEAFALLVPARWNLSGGVYWQASPVLPCLVNLRAVGPGGELFEALPSAAFSSMGPMAGLGGLFFPQGANYLGTEVRPVPGNPAETLQLILQRYRADAQNVRLIDLIAQSNAMPYPTMPAGSTDLTALVEYTLLGHAFTEQYLWRVTYGIQGTTWSIERIFATRSPSAIFHERKRVFQTITQSVRLNPRWTEAVSRVSDMACRQQINHINQIGQLSHYIAQTYNDISNLSMSSWQYKSQSDDHVYRQWAEYMHGTNTWHDPYRNMDVEFANTYRYGWVNPLGEYVFTDSAGYDPNVGGTASWSRMNNV